MAVEAPETPGVAQIVLHRLRLGQRQHEVLANLGVRVARANTTARALSEVEKSASGNIPTLMVLNLSTGGHGPERICAALSRLADDNISVVPCVTARGDHRRGHKLGFEQVYVFPDGLFAELLRRLSAYPSIDVKRYAERARVDDLKNALIGAPFAVRVTNISATGAMLECDGEGYDIERLGFELNIPGGTTRPVFGRVVWRERLEKDRVRLGLMFEGLDPEGQKEISEYVQRVNVLDTSKRRKISRRHEPRAVVTYRTRRDYFLVEPISSRKVRLVPKRPFHVPYRLGDSVTLRFEDLDGYPPRVHGRLSERFLTDPDRLDSRVGWTVKLQRERTHTHPTATRDDELNAQDPSVAAFFRAWTPLSDVDEPHPEGTRWMLLVPPPVAHEGSATRQLFSVQRRGTALELFFDLDYRATWLDPTRNRLVMGRHPDADLPFAHPTVSKWHAEMRFDNAQSSWVVKDNDSSNGTFIRRNPITDAKNELAHTPVRLPSHAIVFLGKQRIHILSEADAAKLWRTLEVPSTPPELRG